MSNLILVPFLTIVGGDGGGGGALVQFDTVAAFMKSLNRVL